MQSHVTMRNDEKMHEKPPHMAEITLHILIKINGHQTNKTAQLRTLA